VHECLRGVVLRVGTFKADGNPVGWAFDCAGVVPALDIEEDGTVRLAGWTAAELRELWLWLQRN